MPPPFRITAPQETALSRLRALALAKPRALGFTRKEIGCRDATVAVLVRRGLARAVDSDPWGHVTQGIYLPVWDPPAVVTGRRPTREEILTAAILEGLRRAREAGLTREADVTTTIKVAIDAAGLKVVSKPGRQWTHP